MATVEWKLAGDTRLLMIRYSARVASRAPQANVNVLVGVHMAQVRPINRSRFSACFSCVLTSWTSDACCGHRTDIFVCQPPKIISRWYYLQYAKSISSAKMTARFALSSAILDVQTGRFAPKRPLFGGSSATTVCSLRDLGIREIGKKVIPQTKTANRSKNTTNWSLLCWFRMNTRTAVTTVQFFCHSGRKGHP